MNITYRKSLLAGMIATLMAAPGGLAAQQLQAPQADSERQGQQIGDAPAPVTAAPETNPASGALILGTDPLLSALTPQNLEQMEVIDVSGEKIGKVEDVVRSREDGLIYVVVRSGGILGIGTKAIPVPLESLRVQGDALRIATTADDLRSRPEYEEDQYAELDPANQPISEFSAFEVIPPEEDGSVSEPEPTRER
jgi:sporulation protein YlmC with PRC-barrel domain